MTGAQTTAPRWFRSGSASPEFQVPHLADFYTWTVEQQLPLTVASYLRYAADHPGSLPDAESADLGRVAGDLSYLYRLTLDEDQHGLHLEVYDLSARPRGRARLGRPVESLTQADLHEAAARCCDTVAARCERYADTNAGIPMPGGEPRIWLDRAAGYRQRHASTPIRAVVVNLAAVFHPATFDVVQPAIQVAGVWVFAYINPAGGPAGLGAPGRDRAVAAESGQHRPDAGHRPGHRRLHRRRLTTHHVRTTLQGGMT